MIPDTHPDLLRLQLSAADALVSIGLTDLVPRIREAQDDLDLLDAAVEAFLIVGRAMTVARSLPVTRERDLEPIWVAWWALKAIVDEMSRKGAA